MAGTWPEWVPQEVREHLRAEGVGELWSHQSEAAEAAHRGQHVALATGTASGKTLSYLLPILAATGPRESEPVLPGLGRARPSALTSRRRLALTGTRTTALYLAPTKALAHDQVRVSEKYGPPGWRHATLDGDSTPEERRFAREFATYVLTNPDMLHRSVLPNHARWRSFLSGLAYVVVDEAHRYRGVLGAHVALVLRRLRRLCALYGSQPVFICASATTSDAGRAAGLLLGENPGSIAEITGDGSPRGARDVVFWQPVGGTDQEAAEILARCVDDGLQTVAFVRSRVGAERVARTAQTRVAAGAVSAYRAGYLPHERRELEKALQTGALRGVAATNALELGIDVTGLDAVIIAGFPGSIASVRQQAGRAGRRGGDSLVVIIASDDPLDAYLFDHPELLLDSPVEATVLHPENPAILGPHLGAAAQEAPLTEADARWFGASSVAIIHKLADHGTLRLRASGWFWCHPSRAVDAIDLRSSGGKPYDIVEPTTGRVLGSISADAVETTAHPGAVYVHQGEPWLVEELDRDEGEALVRPCHGHYVTQPLVDTSVKIVAEQLWRPLGAGEVHRGIVDVTRRVTGFLRRSESSGVVIGREALDLPARSVRTMATWFTLPAGPTGLIPGGSGSGAAHAVEHVALALLPTVALNDAGDVAGFSSACHPDTGHLTVFVHDSQPGGSGFCAAGYVRGEAWLTAALSRLLGCPCEAGCPKCCVSFRCSTGNDNLDKAGAVSLLRAWVS